MARTHLVFCTAREKDVRHAIQALPEESGEVLFFGPASSSLNQKLNSRFLSWGKGAFTLSTALRFARHLKSLRPARVILPLNNREGSGYSLLRLFARWLSPHAFEVAKDSEPRRIEWSSFLNFKEELWHSGLIAIMSGLSPLFRLWLKPHTPPVAKPPSRPPMHPEVLQDFYTKEAPDVSIIIRTFNEERYLAKTLRAVERQQGPSREVIVIDSGSTDGTVEIARSFSVRVVQIAPASFHYSAALNLGADLARGCYLVHVSAHSVPQNNTWLENLISPMQNDPQVAGVCGREVPIDIWTSPFERKLLGDIFGDKKREMNESFFFSNANAAVRKDRVEATPFDESVDWGEDQVWAHAMHRQGFKTVYTPDSIVAHSHNLTMAQCFNRTLKFQRTLFRHMHADRADKTHSAFRNQLPARAASFRRFLTQNNLAPTWQALVYAPFCEFVNFLGSDVAHREWRTHQQNRSIAKTIYPAPEKEVVSS